MKKRLKRISAFFTIALLVQMMLPFGQVYAESIKLADGIYVETYISEIKVSGGNTAAEAKTPLEDGGFKIIDLDLNKGAGGDYIYLGYKTTTEYSDAIKDIYIVHGWDKDYSNTKKEVTNGLNYYTIGCLGSESFIKSNGDMNHGTDAHWQIYLLYTKDEYPDKKALTYFSAADTTGISSSGISDGTALKDIYIDLNNNCQRGSACINLKVKRNTTGTKVNPMNIDSRNWMSSIYDNVKITALNIPGCHDAGMNHSVVYPDKIGDTFVNTQKHPIGSYWIYNHSIRLETFSTKSDGQNEKGLLDMGYRYFDIRYGVIDKDDDPYGLRIVHNSIPAVYWTDEILGVPEFKWLTNDVLMKWIKDFLDANPSETVILDCSANDNGDDAETEKRMTEFFKFIANNPNNGKYPNIYIGDHVPTLGECRGKIVLLTDGISTNDLKIGNKYFGFKNAGGVGDKNNKTTGKMEIDEKLSKEMKYEVYKNNQWDGVFNEEKWEWVSNGLRDSQGILDKSAQEKVDPFVLIYSSANNGEPTIKQFVNLKELADLDPSNIISYGLGAVKVITALENAAKNAKGTIEHYSKFVNPMIEYNMINNYSNKFVGIIATDNGGEDLSRAIWQSNFTRTLPRSGSVFGGGNIWIIIAIIGLFAVVVAACVVVFIRSKKKALAFAQADASEAFENTETFDTPETTETETPTL